MKKNTQNPNTSISQTSILLNRKFKIILSFVVVGIVIFYFGFVLLSNYTVKYLSVEETLNIESINNEVLGVSGKLVENSYHKDADGLTAYFSIVDEGDTRELRVEYKGEIGQVFFNKQSEIILLSIFTIFFLLLPTNINFSNSRDLATSKHLFYLLVRLIFYLEHLLDHRDKFLIVF